jgi:hypothetical protein
VPPRLILAAGAAVGAAAAGLVAAAGDVVAPLGGGDAVVGAAEDAVAAAGALGLVGAIVGTTWAQLAKKLNITTTVMIRQILLPILFSSSVCGPSDKV